MPGKIIEHIHAVCKEQGIKYISMTEAKKLNDLLNSITSNIDDIQSVLDNHNISINIRETLKKDLKKLEDTEHDLIRLVKKIRKL